MTGDPVLDGTAGDDTLPGGQDPDRAPGMINLLGGNDTAVVECPFDITVDGGEGNDLIRAEGTVRQDQPDAGGARVEGVSGSDQFEVVLDLVNSDINLANDDGILESTLARIADFKPEEDTLLTQIDRT